MDVAASINVWGHDVALRIEYRPQCSGRDLKKLLRLADAQFLAGQTPDLPKLQLQLRELKLDEIELETGRPRTEAYMGSHYHPNQNVR